MKNWYVNTLRKLIMHSTGPVHNAVVIDYVTNNRTWSHELTASGGADNISVPCDGLYIGTD